MGWDRSSEPRKDTQQSLLHELRDWRKHYYTVGLNSAFGDFADPTAHRRDVLA